MNRNGRNLRWTYNIVYNFQTNICKPVFRFISKINIHQKPIQFNYSLNKPTITFKVNKYLESYPLHDLISLTRLDWAEVKIGLWEVFLKTNYSNKSCLIRKLAREFITSVVHEFWFNYSSEVAVVFEGSISSNISAQTMFSIIWFNYLFYIYSPSTCN